MSLFRTHIDPFSSFTINLGPLYVERVFDFLLIKEGFGGIAKITERERYEHYLEHLSNKSGISHRHAYAVIQFYKGHFYQQLARHLKDGRDAQHAWEKALCFYQNYQEIADYRDESRYYAQWQTGLLQDRLGYPWLLSEDSLLKASQVDPLRGEWIKKIIEHYIGSKDWKSAYQYSSIAVEKFLDKNPIARRRWFIDSDAYNGTVLRRHRAICHKLGYFTKMITNGTVASQTAPQQS